MERPLRWTQKAVAQQAGTQNGTLVSGMDTLCPQSFIFEHPFLATIQTRFYGEPRAQNLKTPRDPARNLPGQRVQRLLDLDRVAAELPELVLMFQGGEAESGAFGSSFSL